MKALEEGLSMSIFSNIFKTTDFNSSNSLQEFSCFADFFDHKYYAFSKATKRRSQLELYVFDKHIRPIFGPKTLAEITSQDLDLWMTAQLEAGYKPATVNKHSSMLNRILNIAVQWGYLDTNPFKAVVIKKLPTSDYMQRFLTHTEIKSLLSACKRSTHPFLHLFVKLLLLTGDERANCAWPNGPALICKRASFLLPSVKVGAAVQWF
jgi:integrase